VRTEGGGGEAKDSENEGKRLHNEELHNLYTSLNIIRVLNQGG
jgi:hypothetical protein